jgi:hypothetical protein
LSNILGEIIMTNSIKIERNGEKGEVSETYLQDFLNDGWHRVGAKKDASLNEKQSKEETERSAQEQHERDILVAKAVEAKEEEHKLAMARIQAELDEFRRKEAEATKKTLDEAKEESHKRHEQKLLLLEDKDAIAEYVKENFDKDLDKRGSVEVVREKAVNIVRESN